MGIKGIRPKVNVICLKLGKNATETYGMLQTAFRPSCMNRASVFALHKRFKEGSTPSLPSLPGPLWPGVVAPDRALSMG